MSDIMVDLESVTKVFGDFKAVTNLNLQIRKGEFLTLLGPSGCGKTTTLRMIAGFEQPTSGLIRIDRTPVSGLPPYLRDVNTVFQNYALFPHMTIFENVAFGLKMKKVPGPEIEKRVKQALRMVQLEGYEKRRPKQMSGGQQQRVAVARAIVNNPKVLLLDEPLGALDLKLRKQMQVELKHLQRQLGITFIYVTHDQEEALTMSDRIAVMCGGEIIQLGAPADIYEKPRTRFVAGFIGEANLLDGTITYLNGASAAVDVQGLSVLAPKIEGLRAGQEVCLSVRPEKIALLDNPAGGMNCFSGRVVEHIYVGSIIKSVVELPNGQQVVMESLGSSDARFLAPGSPVNVGWKPESTVLMRS